jgi:hypothetical protein
MQEKQTKAEQEAFFYAEINKINLKATTLLSTKMINIHNGIDSDAHFDIVRARTKLKFLGKQTNTKTWDRMRAAVQAQQTLLLSHVNNISYMLDEVETLQAAVSKFLSAMGKAGKSLPQAQRAAAEELYFINNLATLKPIELSALLMTMDEIQDDDLDDERFNNILAISPNSTISEAFKSTKAWDRMYDKVKELAPPTLNSHSTLNINKGKSNAPHATFNPKNIFVAMVDASAARQGLSAVKKSQSDYFMKLTKNLTETEKAQLHHYMEDVQNGKEKDANLDDVREKRNPLTRCFGDGKGNTATWSTMFKAVKPKKVEEKCETKQNIFRPLA